MKLKILLVTTLSIIIISINIFMFNRATSVPDSNFKKAPLTFKNESNDKLLSDRKYYSLNTPLQNWPNYSVAIKTTKDHFNEKEANKNNN